MVINASESTPVPAAMALKTSVITVRIQRAEASPSADANVPSKKSGCSDSQWLGWPLAASTMANTHIGPNVWVMAMTVSVLLNRGYNIFPLAGDPTRRSSAADISRWNDPRLGPWSLYIASRTPRSFLGQYRPRALRQRGLAR